MTAELVRFLESIRDAAKLSPAEESNILGELKTHIEDEVQELMEAGLTEEEAVKKCLGRMGNAKLIARQVYETYSQGSWKQVLLASMPHLLFGLLFVLNWWHYLGWLSLALVLILAIAVYGWVRGKPTWLFPWLGYCLIPVLAVGITLLYIPRGWSFLVLLVYFPLALWWVLKIIVQATRRDWLLTTLMLMPLPVVAGWFLVISPSARISEHIFARLYLFAPWIGLSFFMMAATIAVFIRLRQRWLRIGLLAISGIFTLGLVVYYGLGRLDMTVFFGLTLVMWGVFVAPLLLERYLKHHRPVATGEESLF
ncbi:MAG: permease prefix domain 1-containing protein [Dehalococcoidales bacterium]|nr:permease prefix domain 1-containing protein [Dehalococcoidales bacterium]